MTEKETAPTLNEKKQGKSMNHNIPKANTPNKTEVKNEPVAEVKMETKAEVKTEAKTEKKAEAKVQIQTVSKKSEAVAMGSGVSASKRHCMYICSFIKNKPIDQAIAELEQVIILKRAIPYKGEVPHRKGKGMMSGRYPVNASKIFISILKGLKGNVVVNGMDLSKTKIYYGSASWASRPQRGGGMRFKRTNIILKAKEFPNNGSKK